MARRPGRAVRDLIGQRGDPMDRRPIWLMLMIYRVWASRRSRDWAAWRFRWEGETGLRGADPFGWDVALAMEAAAANGEECGLLALVWRRAHNGIDLRTLEDTLDIAKFMTGRGYHSWTCT